MKLHYSQTAVRSLTSLSLVLLPYEITLLSNCLRGIIAVFTVLLPYEITLLSNKTDELVAVLKFYYLMKLHYSQTSNESKRRTLQIAGNFKGKYIIYCFSLIFNNFTHILINNICYFILN